MINRTLLTTSKIRQTILLFAVMLGLLAGVVLLNQTQDLRRSAATATGPATLVLTPGSQNITPGENKVLEVRVNSGISNGKIDGIQFIADIQGTIPPDLQFNPVPPAGMEVLFPDSSNGLVENSTGLELQYVAVTKDPLVPTVAASSNSILIGTFSFTAPTSGSFSVTFSPELSRIAENSSAKDILRYPETYSYTFSSDPGNEEPDNSGLVSIYNTQISNGKSYLWAQLPDQKKVYIDRDYEFDTYDLPSYLLNSQYLQTANADKNSSDANLIRFNVDKAVDVYIGLDKRVPVPSWLGSFERLSDDYAYGRALIFSDSFNLYRRRFDSGLVSLGGNINSGTSSSNSRSMYSVFILPASGQSPTPSPSPIPQTSNTPAPTSTPNPGTPSQGSFIGISSGQVVSGDIQVRYDVDPSLITTVDFSIDGRSINSERAAPYTLGGDDGRGTIFGYSTRNLSDGYHTVNAKVSLKDGRSYVDSLGFYTQNSSSPLPSVTPTPRPTQAPTSGYFKGISNGGTVSGVIYVRYEPTYSGIKSIGFYVDGRSVNSESVLPYVLGGDDGAGNIYGYDTNSISNGYHTLSVLVTLQDNRQIEDTISFYSSNGGSTPTATPAPTSAPTPAPTLPPAPTPTEGGTFTGISNGQTVSGTINVRYTINGSVSSVSFYIDSLQINSERNEPYALGGDDGAGNIYGFNTNNISNGTHRLKAQVVFSDGRVYADVLDFSVNNTTSSSTPAPTSAPAPTATPTIQNGNFEGISSGETVAGTIYVSFSANPDTTKDVLFSIDSKQIGRERGAPYTLGGDKDGNIFGYNTSQISNGEHTLSVVVTDTNGRVSTKSLKFKVQN